MTEFYSLLRESVLVQASISLILVCATVYCVIVEKSVPEELWSLLMLVLGFYFGSKTQLIKNQTTQALKDAREGKD